MSEKWQSGLSTAFFFVVVSRKILQHMNVDGELGNKKLYDPRSCFALAEIAIAERVKQAASDLRASGKTMSGS